MAIITPVDPEILALRAIAAIVADETLRARFLDLTGLQPDDLRHGIARKAVQLAALDFVLQHEPTVHALAADMAVPPDSFGAAARALRGGGL